MRKATQRLFLLICTFVLVCAGPMESMAAAESTYKLPWDFSGGMALKKEYFYNGYTYADPTIAVKIQRGVFDRGAEISCEYWVASIKIADPSQLRTTAANGFQSEMVMKGTAMAKRVNAVLAINGDYFYFTHHGYILRQGQLFLDDLRGDRDVLLIDEDGDFHIVRNPFTGQVRETIDGKKVMQAFFFGPVLVQNGKMVRDMDLRYDMRAEERRQRMCIAQVGPLEYKCICCGPPARGNSGMTLEEFARLVYSLGVETAYNLDGGDSTMMIFNGEKINDPKSPDTRDIADIIYFASAFGAK
ncbi:MAG: phosphodiester glycosidase family protein [Clostridia bacterium]|nr:phosphodiester glycosidase family protein [Clostridia bacterium]